MKFINESTAGFISLIVLFLLIGCSGSDTNRTTWLIVVGEDTVSVGEVGETWNGLDDGQRNLFTEKDNTIGEYIVTYGQRVLLQKELEAAGYMDDTRLLSLSWLWLNEKSIETTRRILFETEMEKVSDDEKDFFLSHLGETVFYTVNPGSVSEEPFGPAHLPSLPADMIRLIDTLAFGEVGITESGIEVRLDSLIMPDPSSLPQTQADTSIALSNIAASITFDNFNEVEESLKQSIQTDYNLIVNSETLEQFRLHYAEEAEFPDVETVILSSDLGSMTVGEMKSVMFYYSNRNRDMVDPVDSTQLQDFINFLHYNLYCRNYLDTEFPEIADSLFAASEKYRMDLASEKFYIDRIQSTVTVTQADIEYLFENLEEPFIISERRVLQAIQMSQDSIDIYRDLSPDERELYLLGMPGFEYLAADSTTPQITRPLTLNEVPGSYGNEVFLIDPADTGNWLGPLELISEDQLCMFKLIEVLPERNATIDEIREELRALATNKLEEQATVDVILELENKFGLIINEEILDELPEDPGEWAEL